MSRFASLAPARSPAHRAAMHHQLWASSPRLHLAFWWAFRSRAVIDASPRRSDAVTRAARRRFLARATGRIRLERRGRTVWNPMLPGRRPPFFRRQIRRARAWMERRIDWWCVGLAALVAALIAFVVFYFVAVVPEEKQRCRDDGGRVLEVRDGEGGWICDGGRR